MEQELGPEVTEPSWTKREFPKGHCYNLTLQKKDFIYYDTFGGWETAPIVIPEYKFVFFAIPKVGCSEFKQLFRRMMGIEDWKNQNHGIIHPPKTNGLWYLYNYSPRDANTIMTDPSWTRAMFVRDPRERVLSAYLDKGVRDHMFYVQNQCCGVVSKETRNTLDCGAFFKKQEPDYNKTITLNEFVTQVVPVCDNDHWRPQRLRMEERYWPFMNFIGHMDKERAAGDVKRLLERVGGWDKFGATGWGKNDGPMFGVKPSLSCHQLICQEEPIGQSWN